MTARQYHNPASLAAMGRGDFQNAILAATPGGIERQEAAGQQALVSNFKRLPKDMGRDGRETAEALGFVFGPDEDDIFVSVTAPTGWRMSATEHSMHNDILDACGHKRGGVFYKAAFYDRRADGHWLTRYAIERAYDPDGDGYILKVIDRAAPDAPLNSEPVNTRGLDDWKARAAVEDAAQGRAEAALNEHFPDWKNPLAYWPA